jgi:hypothetical protein
MPFGPTNGPDTFINFIHNIDSQWKARASLSGVQINKDTNTRIIVDDIVSHGIDLNTSLKYGMSTSRLSGLLSLLESEEEFHLPQTIRVHGQ